MLYIDVIVLNLVVKNEYPQRIFIKNEYPLWIFHSHYGYYSYQKQVYQRQILLQQQKEQQLKRRHEEKHLRREVDPEGERQETDQLDKIQVSLHSQHVRDRVVNKGYSPPYRKHTSDDNSFNNISGGTVVKEAAESSDNQQKPASQKRHIMCTKQLQQQ